MTNNLKLFMFLSLILSLTNLTSAQVLNEKNAYEIVLPLRRPSITASTPSPIIQTSTTQPPTGPPPVGLSSSIQRYPIAEFDFHSVYLPFIITIWLLMSNTIKVLYQRTPIIPKYLPESCMLILIGLLFGAVLRCGFYLTHSPLTADLFFLFILPPIIFDAGYFMPKRMFFNNLGTILLMAFIGTIFNIFAIGFSLYGCGLMGIYGGPTETPSLISILLFTSVVAATDPVAVLAVFEEIHVNQLLYIIVFGESLLNDAVTVVIYHVMEVYSRIGFDNVIPQDIISGFVSFFVVSLGGVFIGIIWALLTGFLTRFTNRAWIVETSFIFLMSYLAYLNAEMFHMSGILASTFCGITMKGYVEANISQNSKITIRNGIKMVASSAETVVFILLGVATIQSRHVWNTPFVLLSVLFCSIYRIISVTVLTYISNFYRFNKLTFNDQIIMSLGGLRGAVAFALVLLMDEKLVQQQPMFLTTTLVIIFFTVFVQGILVKPVLKFLNIKLGHKNELSSWETINEQFTDHMINGMEDILGIKGNSNLREKFKCFSKRYIEPWVLRNVEQPDKFIISLQHQNLKEIQIAGKNFVKENVDGTSDKERNEKISVVRL